jgi:two-component system, LytTR family, response regulator
MTCIIIDDEPNAIEVIQRYVEQVTFLQLSNNFRNPLKAIEWLQAESVDLIFLDITMPNLKGTQFARALSKKPLLIFTTAYSEYAAESYELDAVDYLVKPILFERFLQAVTKANEKLNSKNKSTVMDRNLQKKPDDFIFLKSGPKIHRVKLNEILFLEKEGNYLKIVTTSKTILYRANMNEAFSILPVNEFVQVHKSFIISIQHISLIEVHQVTIHSYKIPLGESYRDVFLNTIGKL